MVVMTAHDHLPDEPCHRTREHVPHENFDLQRGQPARPISYCPGVGTSELIVAPPEDPFAYTDDVE